MSENLPPEPDPASAPEPPPTPDLTPGDLDLRVLDSLTRAEADTFRARLDALWPDIVRPLRQLYGDRDDFDACVGELVATAARAYAERPAALRRLDAARSAVPDWFQEPGMLGYVCYVDRFAGDLGGVADHLDYLTELGVRYLHLMPLLAPRPGESDGGYAVADYRRVDPRLGEMADLRALAQDLRARGISLCVDLVCNHTAREHEWARRAIAGEARYQAYYHTFRNRSVPDEYERTLREVFPDFAPGNFTYVAEMQRWVWTTFHDYQWDLNYQNPQVFGEMLAIMLFLANQGVEIIRLDAVAFLWKRMGTDCENQPEAHAILQAFRALSRVAAPALLLKAEAIVPPPKLLPYLGQGEATNKECELAYHHVLMVMLWSALAERRVGLLTHALSQIAAIPSRTAWITYVRCHDDIGWAITEEDAAAVGLSGHAHRNFLSDFYTGRFPGSFARGGVFQDNPRTGDRRVSGACASLAGLEDALERGDRDAADLAVRRILLLHAVIFAFGGVPVVYMGDELGLLSDHGYGADPDHADDNRWMHRPAMDWALAEERHNPVTIAGRIFPGMVRLARARARLPALHAEAATLPVSADNDRVLGVLRHGPRGRVLVLANVTERDQLVSATRLGALGFPRARWDHLADRRVAGPGPITLRPYEVLWLGDPG
ncbi:alpha-amylase family protein [Haliangium sp.]|uniref:alpha-amylase family protein n=1 Tax=Haliangium sp. TaxID=2663208 RepID=UPI003D110772